MDGFTRGPNRHCYTQWSGVYTPCAHMRGQPAQMSMLAAASCAVNKSINRWAYASVYVRIRPCAEQRVGPRWPWSAFVIGWNACAGLRWPWKFNMFELWRWQLAYARVCAGRNRRQKYKQLRRQSPYTRAYARMEYKPGFRVVQRQLTPPPRATWGAVTMRWGQLVATSSYKRYCLAEKRSWKTRTFNESFQYFYSVAAGMSELLRKATIMAASNIII